MTECNINFNPNDNPLSYQVYKGLIDSGVSCKDLDQGYRVSNPTGKECENPESSYCLQGTPGTIESGDVLEYAFNHEAQHKTLLRGIFGQPYLPWELDDLDPKTTFDKEVREKAQNAINLLRNLIEKQGVSKKSEEYKTKMATGLFYLCTLPNSTKIAEFNTNPEALADKPEPIKNLILKNLKMEELENLGLKDFADYIRKTGGFRLESDYDSELSALDALQQGIGACTEETKILFSIFRLAGLDPEYILVYRSSILESNDPALVEVSKTLPENIQHISVGLRLNGKLRVFDSSLFNSNATYNKIAPLTPRQYLSLDYANRNVDFVIHGKTKKALTAIKIAMELDPKQPIIYCNLANSLLEIGNVQGAIDAITKAIELSPNKAFLFFARGSIFYMNNNDDLAIKDFEKSIELERDNLEAHKLLAELYLAHENFDKAKIACSRIIQIDPQNANAYNSLGYIWSQQGNLEMAKKAYYNSIQIEPHDARVYNSLGYIWTVQKNLKMARKEFTNAIKEDPQNLEAYKNRFVILMQISEWNLAAIDTTKIIELEPNLAVNHYNRGLIRMYLQEWDKAIPDFQHSLQIDPNMAESYIGLALAWDQTNKQKQASQALEQAGKLWIQDHQYQNAINILSEAVKLNRKSANPYKLRGQAYIEFGDYKKAKPDLKKALRLSSQKTENPEILLNLASMYLNTGKLKNSIKSLAGVLHESPKTSDRTSEIVTLMLQASSKKWHKNPHFHEVSKLFEMDSGATDIAKVETFFVISYSLWEAKRSDESIATLQKINKALRFNTTLSDETQNFILKMINLMPKSMQKNKTAMALTQNLKDKVFL